MNHFRKTRSRLCIDFALCFFFCLICFALRDFSFHFVTFLPLLRPWKWFRYIVARLIRSNFWRSQLIFRLFSAVDSQQFAMIYANDRLNNEGDTSNPIHDLKLSKIIQFMFCLVSLQNFSHFFLSLSAVALFFQLLIHISVRVSRPATFHEMWFRCATVAAVVSFTITGITQLSVWWCAFFLSFSLRFAFGYTVFFCCPRRSWSLALLPLRPLLLLLLLLWMCAIRAHTVYIFTRIDDSAHKDNIRVDPMQLSRFHSAFWKRDES